MLTPPTRNPAASATQPVVLTLRRCRSRGRCGAPSISRRPLLAGGRAGVEPSGIRWRAPADTDRRTRTSPVPKGDAIGCVPPSKKALYNLETSPDRHCPLVVVPHRRASNRGAGGVLLSGCVVPGPFETPIPAQSDPGTLLIWMQRINIATGDVATILFGTIACDGVRRTPWGTLLVSEEAGCYTRRIQLRRPRCQGPRVVVSTKSSIRWSRPESPSTGCRRWFLLQVRAEHSVGRQDGRNQAGRFAVQRRKGLRPAGRRPLRQHRLWPRDGDRKGLWVEVPASYDIDKSNNTDPDLRKAAAELKLTSGIFDPTGQRFFVSVQHNITGKGAILEISGWSNVRSVHAMEESSEQTQGSTRRGPQRELRTPSRLATPAACQVSLFGFVSVRKNRRSWPYPRNCPKAQVRLAAQETS